MAVVDKEEIREIVRVFYQSPFKVFYVNSDDGENFSKINGCFVSLGLTTSLKTIQDICKILNSTKGYTARLAELKSSRVCGQFLNSITGKKEDEVQAYDLDFPKDSYDKKGSDMLLENLAEKYKNPENQLQGEELMELVREIQSIKELQQKISRVSGWDECSIFKDQDGEYKIFQKHSNYQELPDDVCYRIGIYVEKE